MDIDVDKLFDALSAAGYPTTIVGGVLLLFFYLRKQESGVRADINGSLERLTKENEDLRQENEEKETLIDGLRKEKREAEDLAHEYRRRLEDFERKNNPPTEEK